MLVRLLPIVVLVLAALALPASASADGYVRGEVIVHYEDGTSAAESDVLEDATGTEAEQALPGGSQQLAIEDGDSVPATIAELEADPNVAYAVPNMIAHASGTTSDPDSRRQWNLFGDWGINLVEAWALAESRGAPGGRGAVVAVIDSGVAYENRGRYKRAPDLRRSTFVKPWDFVDRDRHPNDQYGHGTHVAGTIAQTTNNGVATAGIAYNAKIMPLRVLDRSGLGDSATISRAIRYAVRQGADVINLSLEFVSQVRSADIPDVIRALRYAYSRDVLVVGAAGNEADLAVAYPARTSSVLAVAATTSTGCQADYSNSGDDLDVAAPGGGSDSANSDSVWDRAHCRPDVFGRPIFQQTFASNFTIRRFGTRGYDYEGTSMASPHVSAVAALIIAGQRLGPSPTPRELEAHIKATAKPTDRPDRYGAGLLDAGAALR